MVPAGTVLSVEKSGDRCGTVKTGVCRIRSRVVDKGRTERKDYCIEILNICLENTHRAFDKLKGDTDEGVVNDMIPTAAIEHEYHYEKCCSDENGNFWPYCNISI